MVDLIFHATASFATALSLEISYKSYFQLYCHVLVFESFEELDVPVHSRLPPAQCSISICLDIETLQNSELITYF